MGNVLDANTIASVGGAFGALPAEMLSAIRLRGPVDLCVMPYCLHQLDPVAGSAHFEVREPAGVGLVDQLCCRLPGYAVPR